MDKVFEMGDQELGLAIPSNAQPAAPSTNAPSSSTYSELATELVDVPATARERALALPEIVENIMSLLPPTSIHKARLVNNLWHHQFEHSKAIEEAYVLKPVGFLSCINF